LPLAAEAKAPPIDSGEKDQTKAKLNNFLNERPSASALEKSGILVSGKTHTSFCFLAFLHPLYLIVCFAYF